MNPKTCSAFNGDVNSPVSTSVSGAQVTITAKSGGSATNYSLLASSATTQSGFTGTSFPASASGGSLTGGADSYQVPTTPYSVNLTFVPNGSVLTANDNVNGNWSYSYDDFNRLLSSSSPAAAYTYKYDRYGNRWQQNGPTSFIATFSGGNNRMDGYSYDAAGNVLNDGAGHSFTYDAENRIIQVGTNVSYVYDGEGRRIRKTVNGTSADLFYDLESHEIAEMNSSGGWNRGEVFAAGRHIATYNWGTTFFNHLDWLGTERARTAVSGAVSETCTSLPFGDAQSCSGSETSPNHFTGKERDTETNLDYFGARYLSSTMGHWMSPDWSEAPESVPYAVLADPQTLNLYGYVRNNPMSHADADGHCCWDSLKAAVSRYLHPAESGQVLIGIGKQMGNNFLGTDEMGRERFSPSNPLQQAGAEFLKSSAPVVMGLAMITGGGEGDVAPSRLPQDINVNSAPPDALPLNRPVGPSLSQNQAAQQDIQAAQMSGATDLRINQQQVNAAGERVGINRPDLQHTDANGNRVYTEYESSSSNRGESHQQRLQANDPKGKVVINKID